jgi:hypothetical protein
LNSANAELDNRTPRDFANTPAGRDRVLGILFDPENGFPAGSLLRGAIPDTSHHSKRGIERKTQKQSQRDTLPAEAH